MPTLSDILNDFRKEVESDLVKGYEETGRRASGNWEKELESSQTISAGRVKVTFKGADYTYMLENGRGPNKNQDPFAIRKFVCYAGSTFLAEWVRDKGIVVNPFAVAYKIAREGYKGKPFVDKVINEDLAQRLAIRIGAVFVNDIKSDVIQRFKDKAK